MCGAGSVVGIATGCGLNGPGIESRWGARVSGPVQTGPGAHPSSRTMGTGSFPGVRSGRGVTLTPHPLLVPWSRKSRVVPPLPVWTVRSVQSHSACTRVNFTFNFQIKYVVLVIMKLCVWVLQLDIIPAPYVVNLLSSRTFGGLTFTAKTEAACCSATFVCECKVSHCERPQGQLCLTVSE